jgi:2-keto-4-pentenoate hydratase/2-oxohepta-3-ene-1,7-dioic acid hydratase in catechol pathway
LIADGEGALTRSYEKLFSAQQFESADLTLHPPIDDPDKILCVGLNYRDHSQEVGFQQPEYPTLFARFGSSLVAAGDPIVCPDVSDSKIVHLTSAAPVAEDEFGDWTSRPVMHLQRGCDRRGGRKSAS